MQKMPDLLAYFLFDIMGENPLLQAKKMFGGWVILVRRKIFMMFFHDEFFVRENAFLEKNPERQFSYEAKNTIISMNYYRLDEENWENREMMEKMLDDFLTQISFKK